MALPKPTGPAPNLPSKRRRATPPASYGGAKPVVAGSAGSAPPALGFPAHQLIEDLWTALQGSPEAKFYSDADWQRARVELWHGNTLIKANRRPPANSWAAFQAGLNDLLVSAADKRRAGIELKAAAVDADQDAAVTQIAKYQDALSNFTGQPA